MRLELRTGTTAHHNDSMDTIIHGENDAIFKFAINLQDAELFALKTRQNGDFSRVAKARWALTLSLRIIFASHVSVAASY